MPETIVQVISLATAVARREMFSRDAAGAAMEWRFFPAHSSIEPPLVYDRDKAIRKSGRPMTASELACYTSHYKVWEAFVGSSARQVVVMEDDIIVDWSFLSRLSRQDLSQYGVDILKMFATRPFPADVAAYGFAAPHSHLLRNTGLIFGTQCYLLTRRGAEALLKLGRTIERPVDWMMSQAWEHDLPNYCLFPFPVLERFGQSSVVKEPDSFRLSPRERLARLAWRSRHKVMQQLANRRHAKVDTAARLA